MAFPRKQMMTTASVTARRRNALRSTGPRTPRGKAVAAMNSLKHGLRARAFRQTLHNAGYPTAKLDRIFYALVSALKPRNRLEFQRAARYVQMLWGIRQRWGEDQREKRRKVKTGFSLRLSKPERAFQTRIMKDMYRAWKGTTYRTRRRAGNQNDQHDGLDPRCGRRPKQK